MELMAARQTNPYQARTRLIHLILCAAWLASACSGLAPGTAAPPATPQPLYLVHTPALRPWRSRIVQCAAGLPQVGLRLEEQPDGSTLEPAPDAVLQLSEPLTGTVFATLLGYEDLRLVVNSANPLRQAQGSALAALFQGEIRSWQSLSATLPTAYSASVDAWVYPSGSELDRALRRVLPGFAPQAWQAPDPQAVLEGVAASPGGVGFAPQSWLAPLPPGVKTAGLPAEIRALLRLPVVALSPVEPQGSLRQLLACAGKATP